MSTTDQPQDSCSLQLIRDSYGQGNYLDPVFIQHVDKHRVRTVLEIGSRDAIDALEISDYFEAHVYAFECNPHAIQICEHNIGNNPGVTLVPLACWDSTVEIPFYPVVDSTIEDCELNIGASSCLKILPDGIDAQYLQDAITVPATRLDEWMEKENMQRIDLLCMDTQGAALKVLSGLGTYLTRTKYIITEGYHQPGYAGEALAREIAEFLRHQGFEFRAAVGDEFISDALFVRK